MSTNKIVKKRMKDLNITQKQIAQHIGQPEEVVGKWLEGRLIFIHKHVWGVFDLLGLDPEDVMVEAFSELS